MKKAPPRGVKRFSQGAREESRVSFHSIFFPLFSKIAIAVTVTASDEEGPLESPGSVSLEFHHCAAPSGASWKKPFPRIVESINEWYS